MAEQKEQIIKTPMGPAGHGWTQIGEEEIQAVTDLLRTPQLLFRYRGAEPTQSNQLEKELEANPLSKQKILPWMAVIKLLLPQQTKQYSGMVGVRHLNQHTNPL